MAFLRSRSSAVLFVLAIGGALLSVTGRQNPTEQPDKYQWLEDVSGKRSMDWVKAEDARSAKVLKSDPHFSAFEAAALQVEQSPDRLSIPDLNAQLVYNTWRDAQYVVGILRKTSISDFLTTNPHWQTVLDYDALAKRDGQKWVQQGRDCLYPGDEFCLVDLSAGGEDAVTLREFNLKTAKFVENGFTLPRSKQSVVWLDHDTLLVTRDWGPGTMTSSGYPFVIKRWRRGQPLAQAEEIFRGAQSDEGVQPTVLRDSDGHQATLLFRQVNFFESQAFLLTTHGPQQMALPSKIEIKELVKGQLILKLDEDWIPQGASKKIPAGSLVSLDVNALNRDPRHPPSPRVIFSPTTLEFAQEYRSTRNHLLLTTLDNVQARAYVCTLGQNGVWRREKLSLPENQTVSIESTNWADDRFFLQLSGFLTPSSLFFGDAEARTLQLAKTRKPLFDASHDIVEQYRTASKDGTIVPYFIVRPKTMRFDSSNPVLLTAYGGFNLARTPDYDPILGKLWLERGGVFVLANIRGGGEFGPAWHEAGLKTHRQRIYDDFFAVGQDLVKRHITASRRLGIYGGSNGGLLMGVEMTQHPEMWHAVGILVPLLDMLRFEQIAAGASWVAEYGSVSVPQERQFLASISPYNQLNAKTNYPEPLILTTSKDDRVGPVHARKFAARMKEFGKPYLYQETIQGGHGSAVDLKEQAQEDATLFTYFTSKLMN